MKITITVEKNKTQFQCVRAKNGKFKCGYCTRGVFIVVDGCTFNPNVGASCKVCKAEVIKFEVQCDIPGFRTGFASLKNIIPEMPKRTRPLTKGVH